MFFLKYLKITEGQHMLSHGFTNIGKIVTKSTIVGQIGFFI